MPRHPERSEGSAYSQRLMPVILSVAKDLRTRND
jgi:hypothetical protein